MSGLKPFPTSGAGLTPIADQRFLGNFSGAPATPVAVEIIQGSGIVLTPGANSLTIASGGTASGTVTQVDTGTGLTGGPITTSGTASLAAISDQRLFGNYSGGSLAPQALQLVAGSGITFSGTTTSLTITATAGSPAVVLITEITAAGLTASFTFSSITSSYRDLQVRIRGRGSNAANESIIKLQFNGDTGNNYNSERGYFFGNNANFTQESLAAANAFAGSISGGNAAANYASGFIINIMGYSGTTFAKSFNVQGSASYNTATQNTTAYIFGGEWVSTSAITSITIFPQTGSFATASIASLYGIL